MRSMRRLHTYLGCFFAPLLLFYILTGWYQTMYHDRLKSPGDAETIGEPLRTVHVDQIYPTNGEISRPSSPKLFQALVVVMALALIVTIPLGVVLAFRTIRKPWPVLFSL